MPPIRRRSGGLSAQKLPENLPKAPQKSFQIVSQWTLFKPFWSQMSPGAAKVDFEGPKTPPKGAEDGPRAPIWRPKWAKGPPRVPNGPPMVPLGRLWAPLGLPWGGFGGLWVTFGDPLDTSGRHCGHFWCKAPEPSKTNEFVGNPWLRSTRGRPRCSHF